MVWRPGESLILPRAEDSGQAWTILRPYPEGVEKFPKGRKARESFCRKYDHRGIPIDQNHLTTDHQRLAGVLPLSGMVSRRRGFHPKADH